MQTLITGGAGFIGSHLSEQMLALGHKVTIIDNFNTYYDLGSSGEILAELRIKFISLKETFEMPF